MSRRPLVPQEDAELLVGLDATPLLGRRSGVGRYVHGLLDGLLDLTAPPRTRLVLFSVRGRLPDSLPAGSRAVRRRVPARLLQAAWQRVPCPPVELLSGRIDVFHAGNFVLPPLRRAAGVVAVHDLAFLHFPETVDERVRAYRELVPSGLRRAARVVTFSAAVRDELCAEYRLPTDRVVVAPHGVDPAWSHALPPTSSDRSRLGLPERYLVFVGNEEPRKNLGTLALAHAAARRQDPSVPPLALVGPRTWGDAWGGVRPAHDDVVRLGFLPDDDLRAVVRGAVALCLPSRYEGFGLPILEALACGTAVVASDLPAHREVAGDLAVLNAAHDVDAWADALVRVSVGSDDPNARSARVQRTESFTWGRSARLHVQAWREVAQDASCRPRTRYS